MSSLSITTGPQDEDQYYSLGRRSWHEQLVSRDANARARLCIDYVETACRRPAAVVGSAGQPQNGVHQQQAPGVYRARHPSDQVRRLLIVSTISTFLLSRPSHPALSLTLYHKHRARLSLVGGLVLDLPSLHAQTCTSGWGPITVTPLTALVPAASMQRMSLLPLETYLL